MTLLQRGLAWLCLALLTMAQVWAAPLNPYILRAVQSMPTGGGYASDRAAEVRLARSGIVWQQRCQQLVVAPRAASPSFCSAACYMALLRALSFWETEQGSRVFSAKVWESLRVEESHPDGYLSWGRFNSNGPGCAKWVYDLRAGINFTDPKSALPGDFLKIFFSPQIGAQERGHLVVFLGLEQLRGQSHIRFWSANKPGGYGIRTLPLSSIHHMIFTRVTHPERIALAPSLPVHDPWLVAMLTHDFSFPEICQRCGIGRGR